MEQLPPYQCPQCNETMEPGFLVTTLYALRWARTESQGKFFPIQAERITKKFISWWTAPHHHGLRCRECDLVLFKHDLPSEPKIDG